ncbi:DEKNAAC102779 [Brettanomyces naardenensis]|uniref:DEKNAAC102779 n=1 Tax=Brettanomyces naardenensis TaxID=13370 RepID=A0A448YLI4_BRENA|nr:DEKNAAC102779 [Brettanomyces naardenensis]
MIHFVSLISRGNQPLYIQPFSPYEKDGQDGDGQAVESSIQPLNQPASAASSSLPPDTDATSQQPDGPAPTSAPAPTTTPAHTPTSAPAPTPAPAPAPAPTPAPTPPHPPLVDYETRENELLKYNFLSHMALDVFDSPFAPMAEVEPPAGRTYQLLFVQDGVFVFGQETNTGLKIVVGCSRNENDGSKESIGLNNVFKQIYKAYLRLICNPFIGTDKIDQEIDNKPFDERIKQIVKEYKATGLGGK